MNVIVISSPNACDGPSSGCGCRMRPLNWILSPASANDADRFAQDVFEAFMTAHKVPRAMVAPGTPDVTLPTSFSFAWQAAAAGQPRVAVVRGGAGVGKTRLVREVAELARLQGAVVAGA